MADYTLSAKITGDSSGFEKAFSTAQKTADNFESRMKSISSKLESAGNTMKGLGTKLTVGVTAPLALAGKTMVNAASDFDENLNKVDVAFGNSAQAVKDWSDTAITQFGLSKNQALQATSLFGDMATSMGLTQPAAAEMSMSLAGLAGDLSSFKNIDIDQAMTALNGVFTGETESLKQLGIVMTETNLEEFAAKTGQVYSQMSQAEKVQLRYNYVMEMAKNAQGDYARTADGTANSMRTFQGSVDNLMIALGQNLLPIFTPLVQKATEMVNAFANADPKIQQMVIKIGLLAAVVGPALIAMGSMVSGAGKVVGAIGGISKAIGFIASPIGIAVAAIMALSAAFVYLMNTNDGFRSGVMSLVSVIGSNLTPIIQTLITTLSGIISAIMPGIQSAITSLLPVVMQIVGMITQMASTVLPVLVSLFNQLSPFLVQLASLIGQVAAMLAPMITQLVGALLPVITNIITVVMNIVTSVMPAVIAIINVVMSLIQTLAPIIMDILSIVISVVSGIISAISPIVSIIGGIISGIMAVISPIVTFIANIIATIIQVIGTVIEAVTGVFSTVFSIVSGVFTNISGFISTVINAISTVISTLTGVVGGVFNGIYSVVSSVMGNVRSFITGVFDGIKSAWNGLTSFVSGVFSGIGSAVQTLVGQVKGFVNGVIGGINAAIGVINMIPGVNIGRIPYLAHGTDNWQGGFAYMNEGGRGELTYLPNGAQVIPHDISVKYAKESARANATAEPIDMSGFMEGMIIQIVNNTSVDGTPLKETISDYTIRKIGNQQRAVLRAKGATA